MSIRNFFFFREQNELKCVFLRMLPLLLLLFAATAETPYQNIA